MAGAEVITSIKSNSWIRYRHDVILADLSRFSILPLLKYAVIS